MLGCDRATLVRGDGNALKVYDRAVKVSSARLVAVSFKASCERVKLWARLKGEEELGVTMEEVWDYFVSARESMFPRVTSFKVMTGSRGGSDTARPAQFVLATRWLSHGKLHVIAMAIHPQPY
jgi:hypothetical protein